MWTGRSAQRAVKIRWHAVASLDHRRHVLLHIYQPSLRSPWWAARSGLEARSAALTRALPVTVESNRTNDLAGKYRTDDIVELLTAVGTEMSINQVIVELHNAGRPHENYDNVSADLAYLVERGRAARVRRGVYAAIRDPEADADYRIVVTLTQGNLNNSHIYLTRHLDFFPADAIGGANRQAGQGRLLTLRFEGLSDVAETDIASDKKIFRLRNRLWREFFERHSLRAGDKVAIELRSEYEYRVVPVR